MKCVRIGGWGSVSVCVGVEFELLGLMGVWKLGFWLCVWVVIEGVGERFVVRLGFCVVCCCFVWLGCRIGCFGVWECCYYFCCWGYRFCCMWRYCCLEWVWVDWMGVVILVCWVWMDWMSCCCYVGCVLGEVFNVKEGWIGMEGWWYCFYLVEVFVCYFGSESLVLDLNLLMGVVLEVMGYYCLWWC